MVQALEDHMLLLSEPTEGDRGAEVRFSLPVCDIAAAKRQGKGKCILLR